ncbi:MAG TPA: ABC transporter permease [Gaiellaceae bacterium]|jgi:molybdate transport system permease protein|nr:ABC transporter permease [Gaiellaceae bacterium]
MRRAFPLLLGLALGVALVFLVLPVLALFLRVPPGELVAQLGEERARQAIVVSLKTSLVAHALVLLVGTPAAYLLATRSFRGRSLVVSVLDLPLVLPPAVAGLGLLAAFGRSGLLGRELDALGVQIPFTQVAVVLAVCFVASPFYIRAAIAAFEGVDERLVAAARTLGAGEARAFLRVSLPLAAGGLGAGSTVAFARGLGEFGATIMFAGSLPGRTQTAPLAIYDALDEEFGVALALGALLVVVSLVILVVAKAVPAWTRSAQTSPSRAATSPSR